MAFYWRDWPGSEEYWVGKTFGKIFVNHGLYLREAVSALNGFDEESFHFYHADGDLCLRMWREGYEVVDCPDAFIEHFSHANVRVRQGNVEYQRADWEAYSRRWKYLRHDPPMPISGGTMTICRTRTATFPGLHGAWSRSNSSPNRSFVG